MIVARMISVLHVCILSILISNTFSEVYCRQASYLSPKSQDAKDLLIDLLLQESGYSNEAQLSSSSSRMHTPPPAPVSFRGTNKRSSLHTPPPPPPSDPTLKTENLKVESDAEGDRKLDNDPLPSIAKFFDFAEAYFNVVEALTQQSSESPMDLNPKYSKLEAAAKVLGDFLAAEKLKFANAENDNSKKQIGMDEEEWERIVSQAHKLGDLALQKKKSRSMAMTTLFGCPGWFC